MIRVLSCHQSFCHPHRKPGSAVDAVFKQQLFSNELVAWLRVEMQENRDSRTIKSKVCLLTLVLHDRAAIVILTLYFGPTRHSPEAWPSSRALSSIKNLTSISLRWCWVQ